MRRLLTTMLVLALVLVGGCRDSGGDTGDKLFADMSANMREMAAILTAVTDEASAHAAVPKIAAVREKMRDCARRARAMPRQDPEDQKRSDDRAQAMMAELMPGLLENRSRLDGRPELMAIIAPALEGMENDL